MSEFHVEVVRLGKIAKHPNADTLEITTVRGSYTVIFKEGQYKQGDLVAFVPEDALVPLTDERWTYLRPKDWVPESGKRGRIKAIRLRNIFSMGVITPAEQGWVEGQNVQALLNIDKWEPEIPTEGSQCEKDPGFLPTYTDIESLRRWPNVIIPGEEIILTEKLHGCVSSHSQIQMEDGSYRRAKDVYIGEYIAGVNENGQMVAAKVLRVFDNGITNKWLEMKITNISAGAGPSYRILKTTPNHPIHIIDEYGIQRKIPAELIKKGQQVIVSRVKPKLSFFQEEVLKGKLLGDGSISDRGKSIVWGHSILQREYVDWTAIAIGGLAHPTVAQHTSGYGSLMFKRRTVSSHLVETFSSYFYRNEKKYIPEDITLSPISLAFWYMDDGSLTHHSGQEDRANFAVCSFTDMDVNNLLVALKRLNIIGVGYKAEGYNRIRLNADEAEKLFLYVAPYMPPCMQYKLPERYRGGNGWLPKQTYKSALTIQKVISVITRNENGQRVDFETETGNYIVSGVVVSNCNGRWLFNEDRLWVGSHSQIKKDGDSLWWNVAKKFDLAEKLKHFPGIAIYGEVYGQVQKGFNYGIPKGESSISLFDAMNVSTRTYLDYDDFLALTKELDLPVVPPLFRGMWSKDLVSLADGKTTIPNGTNIREGFVVRPVKERWNQEIGRVILKLVGEEYLIKKHK